MFSRRAAKRSGFFKPLAIASQPDLTRDRQTYAQQVCLRKTFHIEVVGLMLRDFIYPFPQLRPSQGYSLVQCIAVPGATRQGVWSDVSGSWNVYANNFPFSNWKDVSFVVDTCCTRTCGGLWRPHV